MSSIGRTESPVGQPTRKCAATGAVLETGAPCVATLIRQASEDRETSEVVRLDYAPDQWPAAWEPARRPPAAIELVAVWRTRVPEPRKGVVRAIEDAEAMDLFEQLDGDEDPTRQAIRYVLTLLLVRRRLLVCTKTDPKTGAMSVRPRGPASDPPVEPMVVPDPGLDAERLEQTIDELGALLGDAPDATPDDSKSEASAGSNRS